MSTASGDPSTGTPATVPGPVPVDQPPIGFSPPHRQAHHQRQERDQRGDRHTDAPLAEQLPAQIQLRAPPAPAMRAPALDHLMLNNLDWLWLWQLDHLATIIDAATLQALVAVGTARERVRFDLGGSLTAAPMVMVRRAFLAWALGCSGRRAIGFDEGRPVLSLLLQFGNPLQRCDKLL